MVESTIPGNTVSFQDLQPVGLAKSRRLLSRYAPQQGDEARVGEDLDDGVSNSRLARKLIAELLKDLVDLKAHFHPRISIGALARDFIQGDAPPAKLAVTHSAAVGLPTCPRLEQKPLAWRAGSVDPDGVRLVAKNPGCKLVQVSRVQPVLDHETVEQDTGAGSCRGDIDADSRSLRHALFPLGTAVLSTLVDLLTRYAGVDRQLAGGSPRVHKRAGQCRRADCALTPWRPRATPR